MGVQKSPQCADRSDCCSGDLSQLIEEMRNKKQLFAEVDIWRFIYFISLALVHMHSKRVMHRGALSFSTFVHAV